MNIIAFNTEAEAEALERLAWIETVRQDVTAGKVAKTPQGQHVYDVTNWLDNDIAELCLFGRRQGMVTENGLTVRFSNVVKAYNLDKWWIVAPEGVLDLSSYEIIELPESWIPPLDGV